MRRLLILLVPFLCFPVFAAQTVVSFDHLLPGPGQNIHTTSVSVAAATFLNTYTDWGGGYGSWGGFAFSTVSNVTNGSYLNQYAAAQARSNAYAVAYHNTWDDIVPEIVFDLPAAPQSAWIDNTTYAALAMRTGSAFNAAFSTGDFFIVKLTAYDLNGRALATNIHFLADFTGTNKLIQTNWTRLDLNSFGEGVTSIRGTVETSDGGVPTYFALADFTYAYAGLDSGISGTNPAILCWADGWTDYAPGTNVDLIWQTPNRALGPAEVRADGLQSTNGVVCLGDNGSITLTFPAPVADGPGPDFAVFENAISDGGDLAFCELARCEVSSDGTNFFPFPVHCLETELVTFWTDPTAYGGFAGKHTQGIGTPFDLRALAGTPGLDVRRVTHVKLIDVKGDGSNLDCYGNPIYDPTPTVGSGGFDLDAVGVLNARIDISADPAAAAPTLPDFEAILEYKAHLGDSAWTTHAPAQGAPGFFRYRLVK